MSLEQVLSGGDLRSTGAADKVAAELLAGAWVTDDFVRLIERAEPVVRMRAADALEKASRKSPELLTGYAPRVLAMLAVAQPKEVRWHLLQMTPRFSWSAKQYSTLLLAVEAAFTDKSAIVQVSALQAMSELARRSAVFAAPYQFHLSQAAHSGRPSLQARARQLGTKDAA